MNVSVVDSIGEVIRSGRRTRGMTQQQLADEIHVSRQKVNRWENGKSDIYFWDLVDVCKVLGIQIDFTISGG